MYTLKNKLIKLKFAQTLLVLLIKTRQIKTLKKGTLFLSRCKPTIDLTTFELGCLGPAVSNGSILLHCFWFYLTLAITGSFYCAQVKFLVSSEGSLCFPQQLAIVMVFSCLKRRNKLKLEYCHGYPGLVMQVLPSLH